MSRLSRFISKPEDFDRCFWDILLLLAREPAFEFLREVLSAPPSAPEEASSDDSWHHQAAETSETGSEEATPPAKVQKVDDLPHVEETRGLFDDGEWSTEDQASGGLSPNPVGQWSMEALRLLEQSGFPAIWKAYSGGLLLFIAYRATVRFPSVWPIPGYQIRGFLLSLDAEGVAAPKILTYLSGLSYLSQTFNFQDPLQDFFTTHMIVRMQWRRRPPIPLSQDTLESLLEALESVCSCFYECLMFRALFLLAFHVALRPKEMVAKTCTTFHAELLCLDDIEVEEDRVGIHIPAPEMGEGRLTYWLTSSDRLWLCPVLALKNYLAVRPKGDGPLFLYSSERLLCKERFLEVFHDALRRLNLPVQRYGLHSFWLGSLTNAVCCDFPERIIFHLARWPWRPHPGRPEADDQV
ncbi:uncharacterized protein [Erythrolamprus reginae]|uniref:uncharacterized protein n=1 Tax=Erythrolamprus reginae TaxID=121349 RepID=UPI00396CB91F